jgi:hypothetical protein
MTKKSISIFEKIMIILTDPMIKFYNSKIVHKNAHIFISTFAGLAVFSVVSIYYFHFTKGIDYKQSQKYGKRTLLHSMYVKPPLSYDISNKLSAYYAALSPR